VNPKAPNLTILDKIKVAREVAKLPAQLKELDLRRQMDRLVRFVRECNI